MKNINFKNNKQKGFTLLETVLVLAFIGIMVILSQLTSITPTLVSAATLSITYFVYKRDKPTIDIEIRLWKDDENKLILGLKKAGECPQTSSAGFFMVLQITNSGFRTITAKSIVNEKGKLIQLIIDKSSDKLKFGWTLKEGDEITKVLDVSKHGVELLKNASKIYIQDSVKRKYLVKSYNNEELNQTKKPA